MVKKTFEEKRQNQVGEETASVIVLVYPDPQDETLQI
jgi:hypothetical protein